MFRILCSIVLFLSSNTFLIADNEDQANAIANIYFANLAKTEATTEKSNLVSGLTEMAVFNTQVLIVKEEARQHLESQNYSPESITQMMAVGNEYLVGGQSAWTIAQEDLNVGNGQFNNGNLNLNAAITQYDNENYSYSAELGGWAMEDFANAKAAYYEGVTHVSQAHGHYNMALIQFQDILAMD